MEILDKSEAHLANTEVLAFLREQRQLMTSSQKSGNAKIYINQPTKTFKTKNFTRSNPAVFEWICGHYYA